MRYPGKSPESPECDLLFSNIASLFRPHPLILTRSPDLEMTTSSLTQKPDLEHKHQSKHIFPTLNHDPDIQVMGEMKDQLMGQVTSTSLTSCLQH